MMVWLDSVSNDWLVLAGGISVTPIMWQPSHLASLAHPRSGHPISPPPPNTPSPLTCTSCGPFNHRAAAICDASHSWEGTYSCLPLPSFPSHEFIGNSRINHSLKKCVLCMRPHWAPSLLSPSAERATTVIIRWQMNAPPLSRTKNAALDC